MTAARCSYDGECGLPSQIGALERRTGGAYRADPVFQPNNGKVIQANQSREKPGRFAELRRCLDARSRSIRLADLLVDVENQHTDTHGYTEINFAAFAMIGMRFCPRIRGLHR